MRNSDHVDQRVHYLIDYEKRKPSKNVAPYTLGRLGPSERSLGNDVDCFCYVSTKALRNFRAALMIPVFRGTRLSQCLRVELDSK